MPKTLMRQKQVQLPKTKTGDRIVHNLSPVCLYMAV